LAKARKAFLVALKRCAAFPRQWRCHFAVPIPSLAKAINTVVKGNYEIMEQITAIQQGAAASV
jgi:hypothetical protein